MKSGRIQGGEEDGGDRPCHEDKVPPKDSDAVMSVDPVGDSGDAGCREGLCIPFEKQSKKYTDNQPAVSLLDDLETAQQGRSVLLSVDQKLLLKGGKRGSLRVPKWIFMRC
jgi:hypothetical protein